MCDLKGKKKISCPLICPCGHFARDELIHTLLSSFFMWECMWGYRFLKSHEESPLFERAFFSFVSRKVYNKFFPKKQTSMGGVAASTDEKRILSSG